MKTLGHIAYEAYCEAVGWKSLVTGADLPQWDTVKPKIKEAWEQAAQAVSEAVAPLEWKP